MASFASFGKPISQSEHFKWGSGWKIDICDFKDEVPARGTSILGEVRNVEIPGPTQQLLNGKSHDFLAIFALAYSKINQIA